MARNPNVMREMQRGNDRAMQNIETIPEGFNHLRRMYTNIQEPMMDSLDQARTQTSGTAPNNPYSSILENNPPPGFFIFFFSPPLLLF